MENFQKNQDKFKPMESVVDLEGGRGAHSNPLWASETKLFHFHGEFSKNQTKS